MVEYRAKQASLREHDLASLSLPLRRLLGGYVGQVTREVEGWVEACLSRPSQHALAAKAIMGMDPAVLALLTLRTLFDYLHREAPLTALAINIGKAVDLERRLTIFDETEPALYKRIGQHIESSEHAWRESYREKVWKHAIQKHGIRMLTWDRAMHLHVGAGLLNVVVKATGLVRIDTRKRYRRPGNTYHVVAQPALLEWLDEQHGDLESLFPVRMPMIVAPQPFSDTRDGGYLHPLMRKPLVRVHSGAVSEKDYTSERMPVVFEAVNRFQSTGLRINRRVYEVARHLWDSRAEMPGLCRMQDADLPPRPKQEAPPEEWRAYKAEAREIGRINNQQRGRRMAALNVMAIAKQMSTREALWFPGHLDFRGRYYSAPHHLTPQGHDFAKGLLEYHAAKPASGEARRWLGIQAANSFGKDGNVKVDKLGLDDRAEWAHSRAEQIREVAEDPLSNRWWTEADEPWQFLSACFALQDAEHGDRQIVWQDGSANGLQHLSALSRDRNAGMLVNLLHNEQPADIYDVVAARSIEILTEAVGRPEPWSNKSLEAGLVRAYAAAWLDFGVDRGMAKRPVMILPYGGTRHAIERYVDDKVQERISEGGTHPFGADRRKACRFLAAVLWAAMGDVIAGPMRVMRWMQSLAKEANARDLPIRWTTPSGFVVGQLYRSTEARRIRTRMGDSVIRLSYQEDTDAIDKHRQVTALAPNFIHSLDASAMMLVSRNLAARGVEDMVVVHDAYGCHAADVDTMREVNCHTFADMHSEPLLERFRDELAAQWDGFDPSSIELPPMGDLDVDEIRQSPHLFS